MILIRYIFSILLTVYNGNCFLKYFLKVKKLEGFNKIPYLSISFFAGIGVISSQMLIYSLLKIEWNLISTVLPWLIFLFRKTRPSKITHQFLQNSKPLNLIYWVFIVLISLQIFLISSRIFIHSEALGWDAITIWYYKAKVFFVDRGVNMSVFTDNRLYQEGLSDTFIRSSYPIFLPLYLSFIFISINTFSIFYGNVTWFLMFLALMSVLFSYLKAKVGIRVSILLLFIFVSLGANFDHIGGKYAGYADLPLMCFITLATIFF